MAKRLPKTKEDLMELQLLEARQLLGEELDPVELKILGLLEGMFGRRCVVCGARFEARRKDHIYCSSRCRLRGHRMKLVKGK